jgi:hypothetical protein
MSRTSVNTNHLWLLVASLAVGSGACGGAGAGGDGNNGKADDPTDSETYCAEQACADRLADSQARDFMQRDVIRWQCGDVPGVTGPGAAGSTVDCAQFDDGVKAGDIKVAIQCHNETPGCALNDVEAFNAGNFKAVSCVAVPPADDRGQEYCEYFAIIDGTKIAPQAAGADVWRKQVVLGRTTDVANGAPYGFDFATLGADQVSWLEDEEQPDAVVGSCVFTSWHRELSAPSRGAPVAIHGVPVTYENFHMFGPFNSNGAANKLVLDGLKWIAPAAQKRMASGQPAAQHPYWATCMGMTECRDNNDPNNKCGGGVEWRVSDPTIASATAALATCGCFVQLPDGTKVTDAQTIANAVIPAQGRYPAPINFAGVKVDFLRGFRLGTWTNPNGLPLGCRYVEHDAANGLADTHTIVQCDISAGDLANTTNAGELKEFCRRTYGGDVIVHIPLPADLIKCEPAADAPAWCSTDTPWSFDNVPKSVELTSGDLAADAVCKVSAPGTAKESRAGQKVIGSIE